MAQELVYLVDLQVRYPSYPDNKIRSLLERYGFEVNGCNSNIDHDFEQEEAIEVPGTMPYRVWQSWI